MTHVVTDNCNGCKFTDCVPVCPVDCFYEVEQQLIIDPDECIDCSACVAECPVEAIWSEDELPERHLSAIEFNAAQAELCRDRGDNPIVDPQFPQPGALEKRRSLGY